MAREKKLKPISKPLPKKEIQHTEWMLEKHPKECKVRERVLFFNPAKLYKKLGDRVNPTKRHQGLQMEGLFPKLEWKCACGCKLPVKGSAAIGDKKAWHQKWATNECSDFAGHVLSIINNYFGKPALFITLYYGDKCSECEETTCLELDHIVGVKHGGGGCWLSNYRWLCKTHHNKKTNKDFKKGEFKVLTTCS